MELRKKPYCHRNITFVRSDDCFPDNCMKLIISVWGQTIINYDFYNRKTMNLF